MWDGFNGGGTRQFDGTFTGRTFPEYMDPEGRFSALTILRLQGKNKKALPKKPYMIRKTIEKCAGGKIEGGYSEDKDDKTYALKVKRPDQVKRLMALACLSDGTPVEVVAKCEVTCSRTVKASDEEIREMLSDNESFELESFRRITRRGVTKDDIINTPTIIVHVKGTTIPEFVDFGFNRCRTRPYYPSPMQCFNCWAFGHPRARCRQAQPTCGTCSGGHPCPEGGPKCTEPSFCKRCNSNEHSLAARSCPTYKDEAAIQKLKVDRGLSYPDARRLYENTNRSRSYAKITSTTGNVPNGTPTVTQINPDPSLAEALKAISDLSGKIDFLANELAKKDRIIEQLQNQQRQPAQPLVSTQMSDQSMMAQFMEQMKKMHEETQLTLQAMASRIVSLEEKSIDKDATIAKQEKELLITRNVINQLQSSSTKRPRLDGDSDPEIDTEMISDPLEISSDSADSSPNPPPVTNPNANTPRPCPIPKAILFEKAASGKSKVESVIEQLVKKHGNQNPTSPESPTTPRNESKGVAKAATGGGKHSPSNSPIK